MRAGALLALLLAIPGCAVFRGELPPWARPTPVAASSPASPSSGSAGTVTGPGTPATGAAGGSAPRGSVQSPAPPPVPPAAPVGPPAGPPPAGPPPAPSPPLTASLPPAEVRRLRDDAQRRIEEAERLLHRLEGRPLAPNDLETLRLAQSLVEQARRALGGEEYERAANLAAKARTLADDLRTQR